MTAAGTAIGQRLALVLADLREHEKTEPAEAEAIVCAVIAHVRAWRPVQVCELGRLPAPTEQIRDPRSGNG